MTRGRALACALLLALLTAAVWTATSAEGVQTRTQLFFRERLLSDPKTSSNIEDLLRNGGFVDRSVPFRDLTGDDRPDAIVRVHSGGAAGVVAVYVFSTDGAADEQLRAVFRSQSLLRASTRIAEGALAYTTARYAPADEVCCPSRLIETTLRWDARRSILRADARRELAGPAPPATVPTPTPTPTPTVTATPAPAP